MAAASAAASSAAAGTDEQTVIVAIDLGTGATSEGDKELTAVLLKSSSDEFVAFGQAARETFARASDDGKTADFLYFDNIKMHLAPSAARPRDLLTATIQAQGGRGPGGRTSKPLILPFVRVLEFVRKGALSYLRGTHGADVDGKKIGWLLTLPAIWDDEGKNFMREAALRAGIITQLQSPQLTLVLEPEGAAISSVLQSAPDARVKMEKLGTKILVMDCGGGTVDITVSQVVGRSPIQLAELLPPSGGPWGSTYADRNFEAFLKTLLTPARYDRLDYSVRAAVESSWEQAKRTFDPARPDESNRVDCASIARSLPDGTTLSALAEAYNAAHGARTGTCIVSKKNSIVMTPKLIESFIMPLVKNTVDHVRRLLADPEAADVQFIFLVGGFGQSVYLQRETMSAFTTATRQVIVPMRAGLVVERGAAVFGMYPGSFIVSRKARYSYGVVVSEDYDPDVHPASCMTTNDMGEQLAVVVKPLMTAGMTIDVRQEISGGLFEPSFVEDKVIKVELYRVPFPIAELKSGVKRTVRGAGPGQIPDAARVGVVEVEVGGPPLSLDDRQVSLSFLFGRSELMVRARVRRSGKEVLAAVKYGGAGAV